MATTSKKVGALYTKKVATKKMRIKTAKKPKRKDTWL
jgi:hypothetical protein